MEKVNHPDHYGGKENVYEAIKVSIFPEQERKQRIQMKI